MVLYGYVYNLGLCRACDEVWPALGEASADVHIYLGCLTFRLLWAKISPGESRTQDGVQWVCVFFLPVKIYFDNNWLAPVVSSITKRGKVEP
jgi:hypothetical protein